MSKNHIRESNPFARPSIGDLSDDMLSRAPEVRIVEKVVEREDVLTPYFKDGSFTFRRCILKPTGLQTPPDLSEQEWKELGKVLLSMQGALAWCLGDWLAIGDNRQWGETYRQLAAQYDLEEQTLRVYKSVCERVNLLIRNQQLSFAHHRAVAGFSEQSQREWLQFAVENQLSYSEFVKEIRASQLAGIPAPDSAALASPTTRKAFGRVFRALQKGGEVKSEDVAVLRRWVDDLERRVQG